MSEKYGRWCGIPHIELKRKCYTDSPMVGYNDNDNRGNYIWKEFQYTELSPEKFNKLVNLLNNHSPNVEGLAEAVEEVTRQNPTKDDVKFVTITKSSFDNLKTTLAAYQAGKREPDAAPVANLPMD